MSFLRRMIGSNITKLKLKKQETNLTNAQKQEF